MDYWQTHLADGWSSQIGVWPEIVLEEYLSWWTTEASEGGDKWVNVGHRIRERWMNSGLIEVVSRVSNDSSSSKRAWNEFIEENRPMMFKKGERITLAACVLSLLMWIRHSFSRIKSIDDKKFFTISCVPFEYRIESATRWLFAEKWIMRSLHDTINSFISLTWEVDCHLAACNESEPQMMGRPSRSLLALGFFLFTGFLR